MLRSILQRKILKIFFITTILLRNRLDPIFLDMARLCNVMSVSMFITCCVMLQCSGEVVTNFRNGAPRGGSRKFSNGGGANFPKAM